MPGFDGTGPNRMGSMTGGGRGFCVVPLQERQPAYWRRGFARQTGLPVYPNYAGQDEITCLKNMTDSLTAALNDIEKRIEVLEAGKKQ